MNEQQQDKIVQYLNEAHATELALVRELQAQIAMTPSGRYRNGLEQHLQETRLHAQRVEERLGELAQGSNPLQLGVGVFQSVAGQALALAKGPLNLVRGSGGEEKVLKNAKDSCAAEALEIATYTSLARLAGAVGDRKTERLARSALEDEQRMLKRVLDEIPRLTDAVARAEFDDDGSYDVGDTGAAKAVEGRPAGQAKRTARQARKAPGVARAEGTVKGGRRPPSQTWRSPTTTRSAPRMSRTSSPSSPRSSWPRSTPTSARTRTARRLRPGSTPCRATSRGPVTTSSGWTRCARRFPRATSSGSRTCAPTSASTRPGPE